MEAPLVPPARRRAENGDYRRCPTRPAKPWRVRRTCTRSVLAIGGIVVATGLGTLFGIVLDGLTRLLWPTVGSTTIEVLVAVAGFNLGWAWYATVGQRWTANDSLKAP